MDRTGLTESGIIPQQQNYHFLFLKIGTNILLFLLYSFFLNLINMIITFQ